LRPLALSVVLLAAFGCGTTLDHCQEACAKLTSCGASVQTAFTCGQTTAASCESTDAWHDCAHCISDESCADLAAGACSTACQ
jgi:hypothetical protein